MTDVKHWQAAALARPARGADESMEGRIHVLGKVVLGLTVNY